MSRFGTGLSKLLYAVMIVGLGLAIAGAAIGLLFVLITVIDPEALNEARMSINRQPVYIRQPELGLTAGIAIIAVCSYAGAVLWQLVGLLKSAAAGTPFVAANVCRLRILAALFVTVVLAQAASVLLPAAVLDLIPLREPRLDVDSLFSALLALVLAEVFRAGVALREDAEGTI